MYCEDGTFLKKPIFLVVFIAVFSLLSGCTLRSRKYLEKPHSSRTHPDLLNEYQARFSDIPFPFDGEIIKEKRRNKLDSGLMSQAFLEQDNLDDAKAQFFVITCLTNLPLSDLRLLYHIEMEQLGWRERAFFPDISPDQIHNDFGFTFIFEKPDKKLCVITAQEGERIMNKKNHKTYILRYYRA